MYLYLYSMFNMISFATAVKKWQPGLVPSSLSTRTAAKEWIQSLSSAGCSGALDALKVCNIEKQYRPVIVCVGVTYETEASSSVPHF